MGKNYSLINIVATLFVLLLMTSCSHDDSKASDIVASKMISPGQTDEVRIGQFTWASKNLNVSHYRNGDIIPEITDPVQWASLTTGAWCYYQNDSANGPVKGKLYNWYAVNDPRGLAPEGWHVSTVDEWGSVTSLLFGMGSAGGPLKSITGWQTPNVGATNATGFTAIPGGIRVGGSFSEGLETAMFWTPTMSPAYLKPWYVVFSFSNTIAGLANNSGRETGFSVRCIKDYNAKDIDGNIYKGLSIGTQIWTKSNLNVTHYNNGDIIPQVTNPAEWANLTTGAWCYYENNSAYGPIYGKLYNWYAIIDPRGLAPRGWHVSTSAEWSTLDGYLGGGISTIRRIQSPSGTLWGDPNLSISRPIGFDAVPNGDRKIDGTFNMLHTMAEFWTSTESNISEAKNINFYSEDWEGLRSGPTNKHIGQAVRCVKN